MLCCASLESDGQMIDGYIVASLETIIVALPDEKSLTQDFEEVANEFWVHLLLTANGIRICPHFWTRESMARVDLSHFPPSYDWHMKCLPRTLIFVRKNAINNINWRLSPCRDKFTDLYLNKIVKNNLIVSFNSVREASLEYIRAIFY